MPVPLNSATSYFDGPPLVSCAAFCVREGKLTEPVDTFAPAVPAGLTVLSGVSSVELAWERNLDKDLRGYQVYRATGDGPMERIASLVESPAYSDKAVESGKSYHYAVSAVDQAGNESARPEPVTITFQP